MMTPDNSRQPLIALDPTRLAPLLRAALESSSDGLLVLDPSGEVLGFNRTFVSMWGLPDSVLEPGMGGRALAQILSQLVKPEQLLSAGELSAPDSIGAPPTVDVLERKDGRLIQRQSCVRQLGDATLGVFWSFRDVSEQQRMLEEHARLLRSEQQARDRADEADRRSAFLTEASKRLAESLDYAITLKTVTRLAIPGFADTCALFLTRGNEVQQIAVAHRDHLRERHLLEMFARYPPSLEAPTGMGRVYRTGKPLLIPDVDDAFINGLARSPEHRQYLEDLDLSSYLAVPLPVRGRVLGVMLFAMVASERRFVPSDVALAEELGRQCALAVDNALLFREAQEAAKRREESLAVLDTLFRTAPVGLAYLDKELRYLRINEVLQEVHGARSDESRDRAVKDVIPWLAPVVEPLMRQVLETGEPITAKEISAVRPGSGEALRHWLVSYYPVRTQVGEVLGLGVVVIDITERKRAEEASEKHLREAQEAILARDEFLSIASHELKTPLTAARLRLEIVERRAGLPPEAQNQLDLLDRQLRRFGKLVDELLEVSQIRVGRLELHTRPGVDLAQLTRGVVVEMQEQIRRSGSKLELHATEPVWGTWDATRLEEVVANLISNALRFGLGRPIEVEVGSDGRAARLQVRDQGPGIEPGEQARIFERFERAQISPNSGGLGLGLYVVRMIVEGHGGTIEVQSSPGRGATFIVRLPLEPSTIR